MTSRTEVHPEFDIETRTWFVPGYKPEAPTIAALLEKLSKTAHKRVYAKDYYPVGSGGMPNPANKKGTVR
jgi:hypothetical protein